MVLELARGTPGQHVLTAVESGDLAKAYGIWNDDPNWQQHPLQYKVYGFNQFQKDWGSQSDYGQIHTIRSSFPRRWVTAS